ncbi:MAG: hypothetical protein HY286_09900 [Planctomycetes bacterium]|nr:hypothetical protein [Planctomycetota bacterium]
MTETRNNISPAAPFGDRQSLYEFVVQFLIRKFAFCIIAICAGASVAAAQVPEGFKSISNPAKGYSLILPSTFDELPVPPDSEVLQMKFVDHTPAKKDAINAEIRILRLKLIPSISVTTPDSRPESSPASAPASQPAPPPPDAFHDFQDFVKRAMPGWTANADGIIDAAGTLKLERFPIAEKQDKAAGIAYAGIDDETLVVLLCVCDKIHFADLQKKFERTAKSLSVKDPSELANADVELHYKEHPYRNIDYRKRVRATLPKGWKADDTDNFIIIYDVKDQILIKKVLHNLEILHRKFLELFPPVRVIEAVSTVRICKDRAEFIKFSELPDDTKVAGWWNSHSKELVFYNNVRDPKYPTTSWEDVFVVLYHEGFHQYIYYACGEIDPHSWFNEGYGDYFSGTRIGDLGTRVDGIGVMPWRVGTVKKMVAEKTYAPLKNLVRFEQKDYYSKMGFYYAEGWSLIFFLNDPATNKRHPLWGKILPTYLKTIIQVYQSELNKYGPNPQGNQVEAARLAARKAAVDTAFDDVEFDKLEAEWKAFVLQLKDPRAK